MRTREDWLCQQLENDGLKPELRAKYEKELEEIANRITVAKVKSVADAERRKMESNAELMAALVEREKALAKDMDLSYDAWAALAKSLYRVTDNYEVVSVANGPDNERYWEEGSELEARERIYNLIRYKHYDHFKRGCTFRYIPKKVSA